MWYTPRMAKHAKPSLNTLDAKLDHVIDAMATKDDIRDLGERVSTLEETVQTLVKSIYKWCVTTAGLSSLPIKSALN